VGHGDAVPDPGALDRLAAHDLLQRRFHAPETLSPEEQTGELLQRRGLAGGPLEMNFVSNMT